MLTGDLVRPRLYHRNGQLYVRALDAREELWQRTARELITLFAEHLGQPQQVWATALEEYEGSRTDYMVIRGLAKVLSDAARFTPTDTPVSPIDLRAVAFARGPAFATPDLLHPLTRDEVLAEAAACAGITPMQAESTLYADRPAAYLMTDAGPDWTTDDLIARYNLELARAALYWSDGLTVHIYDTFKDFWRYLKLFKLMFWATPIEDEATEDGGEPNDQWAKGYEVTLDGPISPFVKSTTRYGRQLAGFLPALFLLQQWRMWASVRLPQAKGPLVYHLNHTVPFTSHFKGSGEFDSKMEANFAAEFSAKFGDERGQWLLTREDEVLLLGDTVMIPDFSFTHKKDGRRAVMEIVGFWHPDYLERKLAKVRAANRHDLILLVYEGVNLTDEKLKDVPNEVLYFKNKPVLKDVMAVVERVAC